MVTRAVLPRNDGVTLGIDLPERIIRQKGMDVAYQVSNVSGEKVGSVTHDGRYLRPLGAYERLLHHLSGQAPRHFCVVAEIAGAKRPEDYTAAFAMVQRRHPLLSVSIEDVAGEALRFRRSERAVDMKVIPLSEDADWRRVVVRELATPFPSDEGPLMRATILHAADAAVVVVTLHHAIGDGMSGACIVQDMLEALDGRVLAPLPLLAPLEQIAKIQLPGLDLPAGTETLPLLDRAPPRAISSPPGAPEGPPSALSTLSIGEALTVLVRRSSRANGTTVHGAICAALVLAATEIEARDSLVVMTPVNLRTILGLDRRDCALLIGLSKGRFSPGAAPDFWQLARQVTDSLAPARSAEGVLAGARAAEAGFPGGAARGPSTQGGNTFAYDAVVSNIGELTFATELGSVQLKSFWGPIVRGGDINARAIGVASVCGRLRLTETVRPDAPSVLDLLRRRLVHECAGG